MAIVFFSKRRIDCFMLVLKIYNDSLLKIRHGDIDIAMTIKVNPK